MGFRSGLGQSQLRVADNRDQTIMWIRRVKQQGIRITNNPENIVADPGSDRPKPDPSLERKKEVKPTSKKRPTPDPRLYQKTFFLIKPTTHKV